MQIENQGSRSGFQYQDGSSRCEGCVHGSFLVRSAEAQLRKLPGSRDMHRRPATSAVRQPPGLSESACWTVALQAAAVPRGMSLRRRNLIVPVRLCRHSSHKRPAFELTVHTLVKTWRRQKASRTTVWRTNLPRNVNELASRHLMPGQSSPADPKARNHQATRIRLRSSSQLAADLSTLLRIL